MQRPGRLRVYFISEPGSIRYSRCRERILQLGFEPVHVPAVMLRSVGKECQGSLRERHWGSPLTPGEAGCFLAHRQVWARVAEIEEGPVLVVEDDVGFLPNAREVFLAAAARYDSRRDWVRFYSDWTRKCFRRVPLVSGTYLGVPTSPGNCTVAYMIGPEVARRLLECSEVLHCPSDDFMGQSWVHGLRELHCQPFPCVHDDGKVSIIGHRPKRRVLSPRARLLIAAHKLSTSIRKRWAFVRALMRPV